MVVSFLIAGVLAGPSDSCCDPSMKAFVADPAFVAKHEPPKKFKFRAEKGESITFKSRSGKLVPAFWVPPRAGVTTAVVMIHEWWGLNDYIKSQAERLHTDLGYAVLAVDMYDGKVATSPAEAGKLMQAVDVTAGRDKVAGAISALKSGSLKMKAAKVGTVGWCFGGGWSLQTALEGGDEVDACVIYYGMPEQDPTRLARLKAPVMMIWAKKDGWINEKVMTEFKAAMEAAKKPLVVEAYDADHAFANPSNPRYEAAAAKDAWQKTEAFFTAHLK